MEPRTFADGHIKTPTAIMLNAGKLIMDLLTIAERDLAGRLRAEQAVNVLSDEIFQLRRSTHLKPTLEEALSSYKEVMNQEYAREFT